MRRTPNQLILIMYLSSNSCLQKIKEVLNKKNFSTDDEDVQNACIVCNFNIKDATQLLIEREKIKQHMHDILQKKEFHVTTKIIKKICIKYKYNYDKIETYLLRFGYTKKNIISFLKEKNITLSENILEKDIEMCSGFYTHVISNLKLKYNIT